MDTPKPPIDPRVMAAVRRLNGGPLRPDTSSPLERDAEDPKKESISPPNLVEKARGIASRAIAAVNAPPKKRPGQE